MQYFDFHAHIILKQLFSDEPNIDSRISKNDVGFVPRNCTDLPNIIQTQIHQSQLAAFNDEVVIGIAVYSIESFLATQVLGLVNTLKVESRFKLSEQLLRSVEDNSHTSFTDFTMKRTIDRYLNAPESFNILTRESFNAPLPKNKINVFFVIEGCHSLVDTFNQFTPPNQSFPPQEILDNLDKLLEKVLVIAINPTHMQQSNLCNHAFGIQLTDSKPFFPRGNGLEDDGRRVIQGIFDRNICVDLKHMSYKSRRDLMTEIDQNKFNNPQPLLCTHAGFTGISFDDWTGYILHRKSMGEMFYVETVKSMQTRNEPQRPGAPAFNMTTINLFNEEIVWIVNHGGMIGVSLDRRIIGYVDKHDDAPRGIDPQSELYVDKEFISKAEWQSLGLGNKIGNKIEDGDVVTEFDVAESTELSIPARNEYFFDHVLLHLKHYFQCCHDAGISIEEAQKHITFGSDFDGLINPFLNLQIVDDMAALKQYIRANFKIYLRELRDARAWANEISDDFVDRLFYKNGFEFVKSFFTR